MSKMLKLDEIGIWSEIKLEILKSYAEAYTTILKNFKFNYFYIDAFAGAGTHISKTSGDLVPGSPLNALNIKFKFNEYHFIDLNELKIAELEKVKENNHNVFTYQGDCNEILMGGLLDKVQYKDYKRALCILDPYGLHLNWEVIEKAGKLGTIDIFLNFPVADINRNVLRKDPENVTQEEIDRMNRFWGDTSWRDVSYSPSKQLNLFGTESFDKKPNEIIAEEFKKRLQKNAGFKFVPQPIAMKNKNNAIVYYLFFASQNDAANNVASYLFKQFRGT